MTSHVPNRSARGCLTCKQRKKKCDETRPSCERCREGDFYCLGYDHLNVPKRTSTSHQQSSISTPIASSSTSPVPISGTDTGQTSESSLVYGATGLLQTEPEISQNVVSWGQAAQLAHSIPRSIVVDAIDPKNLSPLVVSQLGRLASRVMFGPLPYAIETGLDRISNESLEPKRWSLYLGAHVVRALLEGTHQNQYIGWIDRFQRQITDTSVSEVLDVPDLEGRLSSMLDLAYYALMILDSRASYTLLKQCLPLFLKLAAEFTNLWAESSAISIFHTLHGPIYEMRKFVLWDTVSAAAFGTAPLLHYETNFYDPPTDRLSIKIVEWAYGCPGDIIVLLAKINVWRVSKWIEQAVWNEEQWREIEERLKGWKPVMDTDQSASVVARFAIQESWRQAVFVYLYMGMCGVDSADPRVESSVRQIVQLASTIEPGNPFEIHLCMPCLIAGVAARQEPHRALLRKKLDLSRNEN
ncbi:hypothetical protein FRC09_009906, partial [Ceratobasidium sp. 395]